MVKVNNGENVDLSCDYKWITLRLPNGNMDTFTNLCGYFASLDQFSSEELYGELPDSYEFSNSLLVTLRNAKEELIVLPDYSSQTISFSVDKNSSSTTNYSILYWDPTMNNDEGSWLKLPLMPTLSTSLAFDQPLHPEHPSDPRVVNVPVYKLGDSHIQVSTNFTGLFVLVKDK